MQGSLGQKRMQCALDQGLYRYFSQMTPHALHSACIHFLLRVATALCACANLRMHMPYKHAQRIAHRSHWGRNECSMPSKQSAQIVHTKKNSPLQWHPKLHLTACSLSVGGGYLYRFTVGTAVLPPHRSKRHVMVFVVPEYYNAILLYKVTELGQVQHFPMKRIFE